MLILSAYKLHCSRKQKALRIAMNRIDYKKWLKEIGEKDSANNRKIFKRSWRCRKTLSLEEFAVKTLKELPEIDL